MRTKNLHIILFTFLALWIFSSCSSTKYVPDGSYLLDDVSLVSDNKQVKPSDLEAYLRQTPNNRWFNLFKTQLHVYSLSGRDSTNWINKALRRLGDPPVIYSAQETERSRQELEKAVRNMGYMRATVRTDLKTKGKKAGLSYSIRSGKPYKVSSVDYEVKDSIIWNLMQGVEDATLLREGMDFDVKVLDQERERIATVLQDNGYYRFNKEYVTYRADTVRGTYQVGLTLKVNPPQASGDSLVSHRQYKLDKIRFLTDYDALSSLQTGLGQSGGKLDSIEFDSMKALFEDRLLLRPSVLSGNMRLKSGDLYNGSLLQESFQNFARLNVLKYTNISLKEREGQNASPTDTLLLDADVMLTKGKLQNISFEVEGTNSAGDLGAAASVGYQHRNLFHGSETFSLKLRGAYEAVSGLQGDYTGSSYTELSTEAGLSFPRILAPFLSHEAKERTRANTNLSLSYNFQIRPEFTRNLASFSWNYTWQTRDALRRHQFDLLDVNYLYVPRISETFRKKYLDHKDNYILKYNFEDRLIVRMGYTYVMGNAKRGILGSGQNSRSSYTLRLSFESAGNLLYAMSNLLKVDKNTDGEYQVLGIPYAQYLKGDADFAKNINLDTRNSIAYHVGVGIAYPYGNASLVPFEKRYFSGGANSVRGWSVRSLGPGCYEGDGNFLNQTGDIKLDASIELRSQLFWKISGAAFVDAGNIWTIRDYKDQPGGVFRLNKFYKQIAMAYGLGLRMDLDFFILRFDFGMKAVNPTIPSGRGHYPVFHPRLSRDLTFHFAVGYPF